MFIIAITFAGENSRTISEPPKIILVCIQYDTTDANLELTGRLLGVSINSYIM
jgi:hypothetical protein